MVNEKVCVCYCDDVIDIELSAALLEHCKNNSREYREIKFDLPENSTDPLSFLEEKGAQDADILVLDSKLFSDSDSHTRLLGESLRPFLQTRNPIRKIILITANGNEGEFGGIAKYSREMHGQYVGPFSYYQDRVIPVIRNLEAEFESDLRSIKSPSSTQDFGEERVAALQNIIDGVPEYSRWEKEQVDALVEEFRKIREEISKYEQ